MDDRDNPYRSPQASPVEPPPQVPQRKPLSPASRGALIGSVIGTVGYVAVIPFAEVLGPVGVLLIMLLVMSSPLVGHFAGKRIGEASSRGNAGGVGHE